MEKIMNNEGVVAVLALVIGLYAATVGSKTTLPPFIRNLFNNPIFRVVFLMVLLVQVNQSKPHVALAVALVFVLSMHLINKEETFESMSYLQSYNSKH